MTKRSNGTGSKLWTRVRVIVVAMACVMVLAPLAFAQNMGNFSVGRGPNINVGPRININPNVRYSPNIGYNGYDRPAARPRIIEEIDDDPPLDNGQRSRRTARPKSQPAAIDASYVAKEVVVEIDGNPTDAQIEGVARRHRLTRVQSQSMPLLGSTIFRWRIADNRSVDAVVRQLALDGTIKSAQRNRIFKTQQAAPSEGDPAQYALAKLRLPEAHTLTRGQDIIVAVIDSGIDATHPELAGVIAENFDALDSKEGAHAHGTGIAGIIAAHGRLMGSAPSARLLAIRAFGAKNAGAESTSFVLLRSLDYALQHNARIINMSFAGPRDELVARGLAAAAAKGVVLVAAAGNAGPKSPPLFPASDRNVIAVGATDATDRLFTASNRGSYVALVAPGVDILMPAPEGKFQMASGTSMAAAYVSGLAALMIARNPRATADEIRAALASTARDLGPKGRDDQFGAGVADAFAAVSAVTPPAATAAGLPSGP